MEKTVKYRGGRQDTRDLEKWKIVVDLKNSGLSYREIGERLEITGQRCWEIYRSAKWYGQWFDDPYASYFRDKIK